MTRGTHPTLRSIHIPLFVRSKLFPSPTAHDPRLVPSGGDHALSETASVLLFPVPRQIARSIPFPHP